MTNLNKKLVGNFSQNIYKILKDKKIAKKKEKTI